MRSQLIAALLLVPALLLLAPQPAQAAAGAWLKNGGYTTVPGTNITLGPEVMNNFYDVEGAEDWVCGPHDQCFCYQWTHSHGTTEQKNGAKAMMWIVFAMCCGVLVFYAYQAWRSTCGWEEVYVSIVELAHVCLAIWHETDSPATLFLSTGNQALWLRYAEWLLSCPVILIHMANLTGMKNDYSKRTMGLLVTDIGTIVFGSSAAFAPHNHVKIVLWFCGMCYGCITYFLAAKVYIEAFHTVPKGICRTIVRFLAWDYFGSWAMFPILFVLGPEGFGHITAYGSVIAHLVLDITSKNLWSLGGHLLREKIHEHILIHGNLTKKTKINVAGDPVEVEEYVNAEEITGEDADKIEDKGTRELANRGSFLVMRDRLKAKGVDVRASLDNGADDNHKQMEMGMMGNHGMGGMGMGGMGMGMGMMGGMGGGMGPMPTLESGRVILALPDPSLVDFFRQQFASLPAAFEVYPAVGPDMCIQLAQQGLQMGGTSFVDFVLLAPDFLHNKSPAGLVGRLKMMGMRVCAYGWQPQGPLRDLVEGSNLDGFIAGPVAPQGIDRAQFVQLIARMQQLKKMGGGMMGGMGGGPTGTTPRQSVGLSNSMAPTAAAGMSGGGAPGMGGMGGNNPLFNSPPSPLPSQPGMGMAAPAANADGEAQMMQQLMAEINQLRAELGH